MQTWKYDVKSRKNDLKKIDEIKVTDQVEADRKY